MKCILIIYATLILASCTFNYNENTEEENKFPDISMEGLEYVRVRGGELTARVTAKLGERYEETHLMNLSDYTFEQYNNEDHSIDAVGNGGMASMEIVNNNIKMSEGVNIKVDSEDFAMDTLNLEWEDKTKTLKGGDNSPVQISRSDGTEINGTGFYVDVRTRSWVLGSNVNGVYIHNEEEKQEKQTDETDTPDGISSETSATPDENP